MKGNTMTPENKGMLFGCLGALVAGIFIVFWKKAAAIAEWQSMLFLLFLFSTLIHVVYIPIKLKGDWRRMISVNRQELSCAAIMAVAAILANLGSANAVATMSPPLVSAIERFEVLFVSLIGYLLLKERLTIWFFLGFGVVGFGMIYALPPGALATTNVDAVFFSLLAAGGFGAITVAGRYYRNQIDIAKVNLMRIAICLGFMATITDLSFITDADGTWQPLYTYVGICAIVGPFLSRLFKMVSNRTVSAGYTALLALLQPVFAFGFSLLLLPSYQPSFGEVVGCLIMLLGVLIALAPAVQSQVAKIRTPAKAA